jgi:hypothetical protein
VGGPAPGGAAVELEPLSAADCGSVAPGATEPVGAGPPAGELVGAVAIVSIDPDPMEGVMPPSGESR